MSRSSSPSELLYGPLQMTVIMTYVGLTKFMTNVGVIMMASLVGDWLAAIVGIQYGKHKYTVPLSGIMGATRKKSVEGSVGCVVGTVGGIMFYSYMCAMEVGGWRLLMAYACLASLIEATALTNWDNLLLALVMEISAKHLPNLVT